MNITKMRKEWWFCVSVLAALTVMAGSTSAATVTVNLRAEAATKTMPDGITTVPMWGFAVDADPVTIPGPPITVTAGDTLTVNLTNNLSVPVSLVIPGQITTMSPVWFTDGQGRQRVMSFTHEAASGGGTAVYTWTNVKPGTYLYQSGTHPAVQVQMGLYGSLIVESTTPGQAYDDASSAYDEQVVLLYSEIDPALHEAVDDGSYGTTGATSTIDYKPKYFLINGEPYSAATAPLPAGVAGDRVLIRFLNAGLKTHAPTLLGPYMKVIAEDGRLYPYAREQCSLMLLAGKTRDVIMTPSAAGAYPVLDRALDLTNAGAPSAGGMLRILQVNAAVP